MLIHAALHGTKEYPASRRYLSALTPNPVVSCDMCQKSQLTICIGYNAIDLCLSCVDVLVEEHTQRQEVALVPPSEAELQRFNTAKPTLFKTYNRGLFKDH
jgi:hypothetical protein